MRFITIFLLTLAIFSQVLLNPAQAEESIIAEVFDIDGDGKKEPLTDGLLALRYLFDFRGDSLTSKAIGTGATRTTGTQIAAHIKQNLNTFDIDGDGTAEPLTDGLLLLRYLFGFRDNTLINQAIATGATRTTAADVGTHIVTGGVPDTERPEQTILVSASSMDSDKVSVDWYEGKDNVTPHRRLTYHLHISTDVDFKPAATTDKQQIIGDISGTITALQTDTTYYVMVETIDESGNKSWSNKLSVKTVATPIARTAKKIHVQTTAQDPIIEQDKVTYEKTAETPEVGSYISSDVGDGYLRKVTAVTNNNNEIIATTEPASLNEIFDDLEFSTTVRLQSPPPQTSTASNRQANSIRNAKLASNSPANIQKVVWKKTGLTIKDPNQMRKTTNFSSNFKMFSRLNKNVMAKSVQDITGENQTIKNDVVELTGPTALIADPGKKLTIKVTAKAWDKEANTIGIGAKSIEICSIDFEGLKLNGKSFTTVKSSQITNQHDASLAITWDVKEQHVSDEDHPYIATFTAYVDETGDNCNGDNLNGLWEDTVTIKIPLYVTMGSPSIDDNKLITFSGDFTVKDDIDFKFDPEFTVDAKIKNASLASAKLLTKANISLSNTLTITATGNAELDQTKTLVEPKEFVKVFSAGLVPVVIRGSFGMSIRVEGSVKGEMNLEKYLQIAIPDAKFGLEYDKNNPNNGGWRTVTDFKQKYTFTIKGEANASAEITLTIIPDLQIHFYESASARMLIEPYLYGEAGIHGHFKYEDSNGEQLTDIDYWFTKLEAGSGINLRLYAGLEIFDYNIASYPKDVDFDDTANYAFFEPFAKTPIYGLPTLTTQQNTTGQHPTDSRSLLITGKAVNIENPFGGESLNPFKKWTEAKVITNKTGYSLEQKAAGEYWLHYTNPGEYEVRLSGYSSLGWFVRQIIAVPIQLTDNDNDGMIDRWEAQYGVTDPNADEDQDGVTNLEEYQQGTFPKTADNNTPLSPPQNIQAIAGDKQITLQWDDVTHATAYDICIATEVITNLTDCSSYQNGTLWINKPNPVTISPLLNDTQYFMRIVAKNASTASMASIMVNATPQVTINPPPVTGKLNDTGITQCADNTRNDLTCPVSTHPNQDAQTGRDVTHNDDSDGHAGFSFTKISSTGAELPASATQWSCVKDNVTGLIWEVKTDDGGLHDKNNTYTWYNPDSATNGGYAGTENGDNDTDSFVTNTNNAGYCGAHDWRMPNREELKSLVDYSSVYPGPTIDTVYFPNASSAVVWSSSPYASYSYYAWCIYFGNGYDYSYFKFSYEQVRLVRSGQ